MAEQSEVSSVGLNLHKAKKWTLGKFTWPVYFQTHVENR